MSFVTVRPLAASTETIAGLAALLVATVAAGGSVSFMHPLDPNEAEAFWTRSLAAAERGERIVLGAFADDDLVATLTLHLDCPPNQPHRSELAKMMTRPSHRGRGLASRLIRAAEAEAAARGRWLIVLDTATDEGAAGFYEKHGYRLAGEIPDYALKPHGGLTGTLLYWKRLDTPDTSDTPEV